jgi:uncharacterized protein DUF4337
MQDVKRLVGLSECGRRDHEEGNYEQTALHESPLTEHPSLQARGMPPELEAKAAIQKQIDAWNATVARYDSEPQTGEGRKELTERAKEAEAERDRKLAAYHLFELGSAASQLAIVLASAAIITGLIFLVYLAGALGVVGAALGLVAWQAPTMLSP